MLADYHVHYYTDKCASPEMTLPNIIAEAQKAGLNEIAVLKHYSKSLPNGGDNFESWYRIVPEEFEEYLSDIAQFKSLRNSGDFRIYSGVETELVSEDGIINIENEQQQRVDIVALSAHYLPYLCAPDLYNSEKIIQGLANAYCNAIRKNPKVRTLAHMGDGLGLLRECFDVDKIETDKLVNLMEPLMICMRKHDVLWELTTEMPMQKDIILHANKLGVRFCATADAHFISNGWANISEHNKAEEIIDSLELNRGYLNR